MKLNIIIPTYNRADSLRKTLQSFLDAEKPANLEVVITIADNNSTDHTKQIYEEMKSNFTDFKLEYLFEQKQGRSFALNARIKKADGELISAINDDDEIETNWFAEVEKIFRERWDEVDFVGGKLGVYNPKLFIYHYVPAHRLDKNYYRRWLFGVGTSRYLADSHYKPFDGAKLLGVPRWMYRKALNRIIEKVRHDLRGNETDSLAAEKEPLVFAGYFYGKHLQNSWLDKPLQSIAGKLVRSH